MRRRDYTILAVLLVLLLIGAAYYGASTLSAKGPTTSSASSTTSSTTLSESTGSTNSTLSSSSTSSVNGTQGWTTYHENNARTGYEAVAIFTSVARGWVSPQLDAAVYGETLVLGDSVYAATENNSVYSLNAQTGAIAWRTNLGPPVPGSSLQCGDINPSGITGTPVIDQSSGTIFVVTFTHLEHFLIGLNVQTGSIVSNRSAEPPNFDVTAQQQRSALSLANGIVYIPYGGLAGDCGQYHGYVVGLPASGTGAMDVYQVPTTREGAVWAPSGAAIDPSGTLYVATGNGASSTAFDHGDSVISLSPSLSEIGYFAPTNWAQLNQGDADLGSVGPALVGPQTLFQIGKAGVGYLLNASALGGIGGSIFSSNVCSGSYGGTALSGSVLYVPCLNGLFALRIGSGSFTSLWNTTSFEAGPPIVTQGVVWTVDISSSTLYGYSASTGLQLYSFALQGVVRFTTPSAGDGQVFVTSDDSVFAFSLDSS